MVCMTDNKLIIWFQCGFNCVSPYISMIYHRSTTLAMVLILHIKKLTFIVAYSRNRNNQNAVHTN